MFLVVITPYRSHWYVVLDMVVISADQHNVEFRKTELTVAVTKLHTTTLNYIFSSPITLYVAILQCNLKSKSKQWWSIRIPVQCKHVAIFEEGNNYFEVL